MESVWIQWNHDAPLERYEFDSLEELNGFLEGVAAAGVNWGIDDYSQYDTEEEAIEGALSEGGAA